LVPSGVHSSSSGFPRHVSSWSSLSVVVPIHLVTPLAFFSFFNEVPSVHGWSSHSVGSVESPGLIHQSASSVSSWSVPGWVLPGGVPGWSANLIPSGVPSFSSGFP